MKIKKINAVLALLSILFIVLHIGFNSYAYLTLYYNPFLTKFFSVPLMITVCLHAVLGMASVFLQADGTRLDLYPGYNRKTIIQRISAALIFPLLILHIQTYRLMAACAENGTVFLIILLVIAEILFYGVIILHAAVSFSRALITLGLLKSREAQIKCDHAAAVIGAIAFILAVVSVIKGQIVMFL